MKKKLISFLLACTTIVGILPITAFAKDGKTEISLMAMDFREVKTDQQGDNWDWDASDKILTLKDFKGTVAVGVREKSAAILLPEDSTLWLEGKNNEITTNSYHCNGIYANGDFTIAGNGKLKLTLESMGASAIYVNGGVLSIEDEVDINVDSPKHAIYIYNLKANKVAVSVTEKAKLSFPDDLNDDAVYVVTKNNVDPDSITFDYKETHDKDEEIITLSKADPKKPETEKPETEKPETETPEDKPKEEDVKNTYTISIGNKNILKNGTVAYTADVEPYISNGYTMLPLRALLDISDPNVDIKWDSPTKTATISYNGKHFTIIANKEKMTKAGNPVDLATAAEVAHGRMFVSLRDWMKIMDIPMEQVNWDSITKTVTLTH
ncbi:copper amine oxidase N-terminal domain-containing protein [Anaerotignum sp.]|uniref:copper amine oxidase N-terminal domain-containing protein n=1 Tax=Anaerotignum sp. TaxID=2039241 RepID=UPI003326BECF